ncbi:MazG-like family protein [bacterium]|nr:MazG-like family protein [bacterium]
MTTTRRALSFPKLDGLRPSLESTALKLMEEAGELAQAIGKLRGLSGEATTLSEHEALGLVASELLDVAQTAATMMYVLEEQHGVDLQTLLAHHEAKLRTKGYLS